MVLEQAIDKPALETMLTYKGVTYDNFKSACSSLNMSYSTGRKHLAKGIKFKTKRLASQIAKAGCYLFAFKSLAIGEGYELVKTAQVEEFSNVVKAINEADQAVTTNLKLS